MKDKVYYCNKTGKILLVLASLVNVKETTFDEDYEIYMCLNERTKDSISLLELEYSEYDKLSKNSTSVIFDLNSKKLVFGYDELNHIGYETDNYNLENRVKLLEQENANLYYELMMLN